MDCFPNIHGDVTHTFFLPLNNHEWKPVANPLKTKQNKQTNKKQLELHLMAWFKKKTTSSALQGFFFSHCGHQDQRSLAAQVPKIMLPKSLGVDSACRAIKLPYALQLFFNLIICIKQIVYGSTYMQLFVLSHFFNSVSHIGICDKEFSYLSIISVSYESKWWEKTWIIALSSHYLE